MDKKGRMREVEEDVLEYVFRGNLYFCHNRTAQICAVVQACHFLSKTKQVLLVFSLLVVSRLSERMAYRAIGVKCSIEKIEMGKRWRECILQHHLLLASSRASGPFLIAFSSFFLFLPFFFKPILFINCSL